MSEHTVKVIKVEAILPHPNADALEVIPVGGWQVVVRKGEYTKGDLAIYIEPDYMVPTDREQFSFLAKEGKTHHRLKAIRLRGFLSFGLLVKAHKDTLLSEGMDVMDLLGIYRYEPPMKEYKGGVTQSLPFEESPNIQCPKFDVESLRNHPDLFKEGDAVVITEKLHGANAKYVYHDGEMYAGSRTQWLKPECDNQWNRMLTQYPSIKEWCRDHPDVILFGEIYGAVQSLKYGATKGERWFAAFAALKNGSWMDTLPLRTKLLYAEVPVVPLLTCGSYSKEVVDELAERNSFTSTAEDGHMMEGVVITLQREETYPLIGRVCLKHISNRYWTSNKG